MSNDMGIIASLVFSAILNSIRIWKLESKVEKLQKK